MQNVRSILAHARPQAPIFGMLALCAVAGSLVSALQPWPMKLLVDSVLGGQPAPDLLRAMAGDWSGEQLLFVVALGGLVLFGLQSAVDAFNSWGWTVAGRRAVYALAENVFGRLQRRSLTYHGRASVGEQVTLVGGDCWVVNKLLELAVFTPGRAVLTTALTAILMWSLHPGLTVVAMTAAVIAVVASQSAGKRLRALSERARHVDGAMRSHVQQILAGLHVVQAFGQEHREQERFGQFVAEAVRAQQQRVVVISLNGLATGLLMALANAVLLWASAREVIAGSVPRQHL